MSECSAVTFRYFILLWHVNIFLWNDWNKSKSFFQSINNIILGRQVEVISTESASYGQKSCQKHKVHGCISATAKVEWLWAKY